MSRKPRAKAVSASKQEAVQLELPLGDVVIMPAAPAPSALMRDFAASLKKRPTAPASGTRNQGGQHDQR